MRITVCLTVFLFSLFLPWAYGQRAVESKVTASELPENAVPLALTVKAGLEGLTPREASVYFLRLDDLINKATAQISIIQQQRIPYVDFLDKMEAKEQKYTLSSANLQQREQTEALLARLAATEEQLEADIAAWKRRQNFLLQNYNIQGQIVTLRSKMRLVPENTKDAYLDVDIQSGR